MYIHDSIISRFFIQNTGYYIIQMCYAVRMSLPGNCRTRSFSTQQRQVTCSVHLGRPCHAAMHSMLSTFTPNHGKTKPFLERLRKCKPSTDILQPDSCICRLCRDDVSKTLNDGFIIRKKNSPKKRTYMLLQCTHVIYKTTKV